VLHPATSVRRTPSHPVALVDRHVGTAV